MVTEPPMPEHDKFRPHQEEAQDIGAFIEWLHSQKVGLMVWSEVTVDHACSRRALTDGGMKSWGEPTCIDGFMWKTRFHNGEPYENLGKCDNCGGEGFTTSKKQDWIPWGGDIQSIIALYFGIDKKKFDDETEALYQVVSAMANAKKD